MNPNFIRFCRSLGAALFLLSTASALAQQANPAPVEPDGTVNVPAFRLPPSVYLSDEAKKALPRSASDTSAMLDAFMKSGQVGEMRAAMEKGGFAATKDLRNRFKVTIEPGVVAGVSGWWARPEHITRKHDVLIDLSGGAFIIGNGGSLGMEESIPVAGLTGIAVFSVDYRQAPEAVFPAASEDVAAVYRALLKTYKPTNIGIFGSSAGGVLTAQSLAWFQAHGLPTPAAAGIFSASADARWAGDSWFWQWPIQGLVDAPELDERFYYGDHDLEDPLMSPIKSDTVLKHFPPTLLITATRAGELSSAVNTQRLLVRNGVDAELHVWDGLGHTFFLNAALPESQEAYDVMASFFRNHLHS